MAWQVQTLQGHSNGVLSVCFSPDGYYFVSGSEDMTVRVWNARTWASVGAGSACSNWLLLVDVWLLWNASLGCWFFWESMRLLV